MYHEIHYLLHMQITACQNEDQFKQFIPDLLDYLIQARWTSKKEKLINSLCQYSVIDKVRSCLEQFKGLHTLGILKLIMKHPAGFEDVFCHEGNDLTSKVLDDLFIPCLSEEGRRNCDALERLFVGM